MHANRLAAQVGLVSLLAVAACTPATPAAPATHPPPTATAGLVTGIDGQFEANGRSLRLTCLGTGSPTIILEHGEGAGLHDQRPFQITLAEQTTTCAYDRANVGLSGSAPTPRTAQDVSEDLHALLAAAGVPGPYVLVGYSAGGLLVQHYSRAFPADVIGVIVVNPVPPADPWLDEVSAVFTDAELAGERAYYQGDNFESLDYLTSSAQIAAAAPPDVPFEMLISTNAQCEGEQICLKSYTLYEQIIQAVTAAWPRGNFTSVASGHDIFRGDPQAVLDALGRVLAAP